MNHKTKQARNLRRRQTEAEKIVWQKIRNRQIAGLKFRRQYIIENFIVDFYCSELNLIIEIDGDAHGYERARHKDEVRENLLKDKGFEVIRFSNHDVYDNLGGVLDELFRKCEGMKNSLN